MKTKVIKIYEPGSVDVLKIEEVEIDKPVKLGPGDYFGEMGLIGNTTRNAPIRTLDEVKLLELTKEDLEGRPIVDSADLVGNGKRILAMPLITSTSQITK